MQEGGWGQTTKVEPDNSKMNSAANDLSQHAPVGMLSPGKLQGVEELREALKLSMQQLIAVQVPPHGGKHSS